MTVVHQIGTADAYLIHYALAWFCADGAGGAGRRRWRSRVDPRKPSSGLGQAM
jgi:hypothetical protein